MLIVVFRRVEPGIAAVGRWDDRWQWLQKREAGEQRSENQSEGVRFHRWESANFVLHVATTK
jgi:hypothetical protein